MADVISSVASTVITNLGSEALQEFAAACLFESDLHNLTGTITRVKQVLRADEIGQPHGFEGLIERLKDAIDDADDLVDELTTLAEQKRLMVSPSDGRFIEAVRTFFSSDNPIANAFFISREIKRIRKTLDDIVGDCQKFALPETEPVQLRRETSSFVVVEDVIGRDKDKQKVLDVLFNHYEDKHVVFLPIVGTGGIGKTTLAQLVFNDENVRSRFEPRKWVCIGDKFNEIDIIKSLLGSKTDDSSLEDIHTKFRMEMRGKNYLFVLDDVWEENPDQLSLLKSLLSVGAKGSRVLVTTQSMLTAHHIGTISPICLQGLSEEDSWKLFAKVAFEAGWHSEQEKNPSLVKTGKEIAKKCKNLPLVIKVIASLLQGEDETYWQCFKNKDLTSIDGAADTILPLLKLSYSHLSPQLKQCFLYCSLFPKDSRIGRVQICHLWIAQGFITSSSQDSKVSLEDGADQCFKKLLKRSFFQDIVSDEWGGIESFKMHDCLHDLAREVAGKAILRVDGELTSVLPAGTRHFSVGKLSLTSNLPSYLHKEGKRLRTFCRPYFYFGETLPWEVSDLVSSFRSIRVLELFDLRINQLPDSIGTLILLRYLNLSGNDFEMLPRTFTRLHNLKALNLSRCNNLLELPSDLWKLVNLQSLDLMACEKLAYMPPQMSNMTRLQRLTTFVVGSAVSNQTGRCSKLPTIKDASGFDVLSSLENLRGRLDIRFKSNGNDSSVRNIRTKADCLLNKSKLIELNIHMIHVGYKRENRVHLEELLECLQPHSNILSLNIESYGGRKFPSWMMMNDLCLRLPKLVRIKLSYCKSCEHLPILSQLPCLKSLELEGLWNVEYIDESTASPSAEFFTSLKSLFLNDLPRLKGWRKPTATETTELGGYDEQHGAEPLAPPSFHRLSSLRMRGCGKMTSMPPCPSLKELYLIGCSKKLRVMETGEWNSAGYLSNPPSSSSSKTTLPSASTPSPLRRVTVDSTQYLDHLPKPCLHSLTRLRIEESQGDRHFSGSFLQHLTGLENLSVYASNVTEVMEEMDEMSWRSLGRLRCLEFRLVKNLKTLPKWIEYLTNLHELRIRECANLEELPERISQLSSSLRRLDIYKCPRLEALPQGIGDLTSLQYLSLHWCFGLTERCGEPNGEDWRKIMHVPEIKLPDGGVVRGGQLRMRAGG